MNNNVIVFGDIMLDVWQKTAPVKISAEAPVMVVRHADYTYSAGGAGNAAVNCAHLGSNVALIGLVGHGIGNDQGSHLLRQVLMQNGVTIQGLVPSPYWPTIHKLRIVDELGRHLLRVDTENPVSDLDPHDIAELDRAFNLVRTGTGALLVSDYGKGTCQADVTCRALKLFRFCVVNGKPENLANYAGADVLVFNEAEAKDAGITHAYREDPATYGVKNLVITYGAKGLLWIKPGGDTQSFDAIKVEVADVAGAGDSLCATIASAGAINEAVLGEAVRNAAAVVSQRGTSVPNVI